MKVRSLTELQSLLDNESGWRVKEISQLRAAIHRAQNPAQRALLRAAVPVLYAHWEGFVKAASAGYLEFVYRQSLNYDQLAPCFVAIAAKAQLEQFRETHKARLHIGLVEFFLSGLGEKALLRSTSAVDPRSNLSSEVFENITIAIGVDPSGYAAKYHLLDESLLRRRNEIAHGEYLDIDRFGFDNLLIEVVDLLRQFKNDIQNSAVLRAYLKKS